MNQLYSGLSEALLRFSAHADKWQNASALSVVIPVFDAPKDTLECLISVLNSADRIPFDIVYADDASSNNDNTKILDILFANPVPRIKVYRNSNNLGFPGNCNRAIQSCTHDIILLNSDTIVAKGWIESLHKTAYSDSLIASVTPWTNNGYTRLSGDELWIEQICEHFSVDYIQNILKEVFKNHQHQRIITAVGMCMYMKRNVINEVGIFDAAMFNKGYGEETDWCLRATENGYINVLAPEVFIFHREGMSFNEKRVQLLRKANSAIKSKYPNYFKSLDRIQNDDPLEPLRNKAQLNLILSLSLEKPAIMLVTHNQIGGSYEFVLQHVSRISARFSVHVVRYDDDEGTIEWTYINEQLSEGPTAVFPIKRFTFSSPLLNPIEPEHIEFYKHLITFFRIRVLSVHHTLSTGTAPIYAAKALGIPVIFIAHDYYLLHPNYNLFFDSNLLLDDNDQTPENKEWFKQNTECSSQILKAWKKSRNQLIQAFDLLIMPSSSANKVWIQFQPDIETPKIMVIEHPAFEDYHVSKAKAKFPDKDEKLNVLFLGAFSKVKGKRLFLQCANLSSKHDAIQFMATAKRGFFFRKSHIAYLGTYNRRDAIRSIHQSKAHVICILSLWPETFCYTLTEAWIAGIPVIVTPFGAIQERVEKWGGGWVLKKTDPYGLLELLRYIKNNPDEYNAKVSEIEQITHTSEVENAQKYIEIYDQMIQKTKRLAYDQLCDTVLLRQKLRVQFEKRRFQKVFSWKRKYERIEKHPVLGVMLKIWRRLKKDSTL